ncbi:hypothetical protein AMAG_08761 [Allomyces macrogynus ATCC 38327]|uniref:Uncharacterized protein n=1 Tax=Allomyces macrogynus (strain ATCC 38327) TaxID=578462 RepID=A0A0L0SMF8_ALLM3|nr:hypothetical protein AMAG_08761 [Allomyces macrogynus ATCC 38327]|eukprot:KNE63658.1 hypothetical protein AMAG_08761 [Allomyces macrogynus ATCC 38327]
MTSSTRPSTSLLPVFVLLALAALAASVLADTPVTKLDEWVYFGFGNAGYNTDTYTITLPKEGCLIVSDAFCSGDQFRVTVNGQDKGLTSTPLGAWCATQVGMEVEQAMAKPEFSKGYFPLNGASSFKITTAYSEGGGNAYFKATSAMCPPPFKVVTAAGKVSSRAAATDACKAASLALADVTSGNWNTALTVVRASADIKLSPTDAVFINSWDGNAYGSVNLQLTVSATSGAISLLPDLPGVQTAPVYPLCQTPVPTLVDPKTRTTAASFAAEAAPKDMRNGKPTEEALIRGW